MKYSAWKQLNLYVAKWVVDTGWLGATNGADSVVLPSVGSMSPIQHALDGSGLRLARRLRRLDYRRRHSPRPSQGLAPPGASRGSGTLVTPASSSVQTKSRGFARARFTRLRVKDGTLKTLASDIFIPGNVSDFAPCRHVQYPRRHAIPQECFAAASPSEERCARRGYPGPRSV